jgi:hypothetical protein
MLLDPDLELARSVTNSQNECQGACEKAIRKLRSEHPDNSFTREECSEVVQAGENYIKLIIAAALAERCYTAEGIEQYLEEQEVSLIRMGACR